MIEGLVLATLLVRLLGKVGTEAPSLLSSSASYVVLFMTLDSLVRAVVLSSLVSYRMQQTNERTLQKLEDGKAKLRALIDNIHAGVIVFNPDQIHRDHQHGGKAVCRLASSRSVQCDCAHRGAGLGFAEHRRSAHGPPRNAV